MSNKSLPQQLLESIINFGDYQPLIALLLLNINEYEHRYSGWYLMIWCDNMTVHIGLDEKISISYGGREYTRLLSIENVISIFVNYRNILGENGAWLNAFDKSIAKYYIKPGMFAEILATEQQLLMVGCSRKLTGLKLRITDIDKWSGIESPCTTVHYQYELEYLMKPLNEDYIIPTKWLKILGYEIPTQSSSTRK